MRHTSYDTKRGFALVELLTAIAIFGILSAFLVTVYQKMRDRLFLTSTAYEVALAFRETQSFGVSVKQSGSGASANFNSAYGLHFETGSNATFIRFADTLSGGADETFYGEGHTDSGCVASTECLTVLRLEQGNTLEKFCGITTTETTECSDTSGVTFLDISFRRPNPDAVIKTNRSISDSTLYTAAEIHLISPLGDHKEVRVTNTGQISVN